MNKDISKKLKKIIYAFSRLYWLKPFDIIWDSVNAYYMREMISKSKILLDLGSGDGLNTAIMFGANISKGYDRFNQVKADFQKIGKEQFGDIYNNPPLAFLQVNPTRKINYGLELKEHHIKVANSINIYNKIFKSDFNKIPIKDSSIDCVFSAFAFYWGSNIEKQIKEVKRVLAKDGSFIVNLPSEHLKDMHLAYMLSKKNSSGSTLKKYMKSLDGGRCLFVSKYGETLHNWDRLFKKYNFELKSYKKIVNEKLFFLQDTSQRVFFPYLIKYLESHRNFINDRDHIIDEFISPLISDFISDELNIVDNDRFGYYTFHFVKK